MPAKIVTQFIKRLKIIMRENAKSDDRFLALLKAVRLMFHSILLVEINELTDLDVEQLKVVLFENRYILDMDTTGELSRLAKVIDLDYSSSAVGPSLSDEEIASLRLALKNIDDHIDFLQIIIN